MNDTALKAALRTWIKESSGLDDKKIVFSQGNAIQPPTPFITIRLGDLVALGSTDEVTYTTDLTRPGQEITETVRGDRVLPVSIQCFGNGEASSFSIMSRVQTSLGLTNVKGKLSAAGISVFDIGSVQNVTALRETVFEPRHLLEVRCYVSETVSESTTYIETVQVTNLNTGTIITIDV